MIKMDEADKMLEKMSVRLHKREKEAFLEICGKRKACDEIRKLIVKAINEKRTAHTIDNDVNHLCR
jgi:hypothetical protein